MCWQQALRENQEKYDGEYVHTNRANDRVVYRVILHLDDFFDIEPRIDSRTCSTDRRLGNSKVSIPEGWNGERLSWTHQSERLVAVNRVRTRVLRHRELRFRAGHRFYEKTPSLQTRSLSRFCSLRGTPGQGNRPSRLNFFDVLDFCFSI